MTWDYYRDNQADIVYANSNSVSGIFRLWPSDEGLDPQWEFLAPKSPSYEEALQTLFRNFKASSIHDTDEIASFPPIPDPPKGPFPDRTTYFAPKQPLKLSDFPRFADYLQQQTDSRTTVFVVLYEDWYESAFGDGIYRYFEGAFLSRDEAETFIAIQEKGSHIRELLVATAGEELVFPDLAIENYDHYSPNEALSSIERSLHDDMQAG